MSGPGVVGFFGKLPGVGDFVQRRLPPDFVAAWDHGFEAAVDGARAVFGGDWDAVWRASPIWRFALAPGVCGASAWVGVTGPSVDRVGRKFPMVLACAVDSAEVLAIVVRGAGGWFGSLERVCAMACADHAVATDAFDAAVTDLADPQAWLARARSTPLPRIDDSAFASTAMPWQQVGEDAQLDAAWLACAAAGTGCLWWTPGCAALPASLRLTLGLPRPDAYAGFLAAVVAHAQDDDTVRIVPPVIDQPQTVAADDDVFGDLLSGFGEESGPPASDPAPVWDDAPPASVAVDEVAADPAPTVGVGAVVDGDAEVEAAAAMGVVLLQAPAAILVAADNGPVDRRRQAAAQVAASLEKSGWKSPAATRECLLDLHPGLRASHEDLIDPVPEDCAVAAVWWNEGNAKLWRIGAATVWHWRRGQLRPLFDSSVPEPDQVDTVRPGDLVGAAPAAPVPTPGLGALAVPLCEDATCLVEAGDRLLLLATDTLIHVPLAALAASLSGASTEEACSRIAAAAGLDMDRVHWPLAVIEVGT